MMMRAGANWEGHLQVPTQGHKVELKINLSDCKITKAKPTCPLSATIQHSTAKMMVQC